MRLRERPEKRGGKVEECLEMQTNEESHKETKEGARKGGGEIQIGAHCGKATNFNCHKNVQYLLHMM
jgi:hypothetical protein